MKKLILCLLFSVSIRIFGDTSIAAPAGTLSIQAEPLPFFKRAPDGLPLAGDGLQRAVNVSITNPQSDTIPAELTWTSAAGSGSTNLELQSGVNDLQILVPDVDRIELTLQPASTARPATRLPVTLPSAKKWKLYLVSTVHTDIGFTDLQERVRERHAQNGLAVLQMLDEYPDFKWYSETFWQLNAFLELHPEKADEAFARLREKRWELSASYANTLTGLCSSEALNRLTLDSHNLADRAGFDLDSFIMDDVPSATGALPMVLAHSGVKYFIEGANVHHAVYAGEVPCPFWWEGPDGSRVLADITTRPAYGAMKNLMLTRERAMKLLPEYLNRFQTNSAYPYDAILLNGAFSDNHLVQDSVPKMVNQWNSEWAYPQIIYAQPEDFYGYIEKKFSYDIPVLKTDFGGWWEVGAASSAQETALSRRAEERAVTAEMLHSLAGITTGAAYPKTNFDGLWHNILLYNEHTWGSADSVKHPYSEKSVGEWEVKSGFARQADAESRDLLDSGMAKLAAMAPAADWVVFNSLAWPRNAVVKTEAAGAVQDIASGKVYPCQALPEGGSCFVANNLPSVGYRTYRDAVSPATLPDAVQISGNRIENEFYCVTLNPQTGGIQSIYDKQAGRELVDIDSQYNLGELIYAVVGNGGPSPHEPPQNPPALHCHRQVGIGIEHINGPVFGELDSEAANENFPKITLRVRLYHGLKQLDLIYDLDKTETTTNEAVYLAFPFALDARKGGLWLEYPDEILEPARDQHTSACRDWYSVQRWLAISDGDDTVEVSPLDAPLFTIGDMTAETWQRKLSFKRGHVFAYLMNNYWEDNYKASQGGHFIFRYSLTSHAGRFNKRDAVVDGWNMYCPPAAAHGAGAHPSPAADSFVSVTPVGLPLTTIKEAEDANGFVFRLCDYTGVAGTAELTLPQPAHEVTSCNLVETEPHRLKERGHAIKAPVKPFGLLTLKANFAP